MKTLLLVLALSTAGFGQSYGSGGVASGINGSYSPPVASSQTYTDMFNRADGNPGSNWTFPSGAPNTGGPFVISSNLIVASGTLPGTHFFDIYTGGTFGNNQYSRTLIQSLPNGTCCAGAAADGVGLIVHGTINNYYNDAVQNFPSTGILWAIGIANGTDFSQGAPFQGTPVYQVGDTSELDAVGTNPILFTHQHNGVVDASAVDGTFLFTGGVPGVGIAINSSATANVKAGTWTGGTLPAQSTTPSDNFHRSDGWAGVNWWFFPYQGADYNCAFQVTSNQAKSTCTSDNFAGAVWTTPLAQNHSSVITLGSSDVWEGPAARIDPASGKYYIAFWFSGSIFLYENDGGSTFNQLANLGATTTPTTLELDATGTNPVILTVKANGSVFGSPFSDSTYLLTGKYAGFVANGTAVTVNSWTGSNI